MMMICLDFSLDILCISDWNHRNDDGFPFFDVLHYKVFLQIYCIKNETEHVSST